MNQKNKRDITICIYLLGIMLIVCFVSSICLDNIAREFQIEVMKSAHELPIEKKDQMLEMAHHFGEKSGTLSMIIQSTGIFIAMPFGLLIRLRYFV